MIDICSRKRWSQDELTSSALHSLTNFILPLHALSVNSTNLSGVETSLLRVSASASCPGDCLEAYCNLFGEGNITAHVWPYKRHHASARHGDIIMSNCRVVSHARSSPTGMSWCKSCRVGCVWPLSIVVGQNSLKPYAQDVWYAMQQRHTTQMWEYLSLTKSQLHMRTWRQRRGHMIVAVSCNFHILNSNLITACHQKNCHQKHCCGSTFIEVLEWRSPLNVGLFGR